MKTLYLLRHAKSSWGDPTLSDFDRPLNKRGLKAAQLMGTYMRKQKLRFDLVLSSPAKRNRQTVEVLLEHAHLEPKTRFDERLYAAGSTDLLNVLRKADDRAESVLVAGHNPGLQDLLEVLTGKLETMPTAALARIQLDLESWSEIRERAGRLDWVLRPKELKSP
jgi:phosphohistidine phosphatase